MTRIPSPPRTFDACASGERRRLSRLLITNSTFQNANIPSGYSRSGCPIGSPRRLTARLYLQRVTVYWPTAGTRGAGLHLRASSNKHWPGVVSMYLYGASIIYFVKTECGALLTTAPGGAAGSLTLLRTGLVAPLSGVRETIGDARCHLRNREKTEGTNSR